MKHIRIWLIDFSMLKRREFMIDVLENFFIGLTSLTQIIGYTKEEILATALKYRNILE